MNARRMRSGSRKPVASAICSIGSRESSTRTRVASTRSRSTALAGLTPIARKKAREIARAHRGVPGHLLDGQPFGQVGTHPAEQG